MVDAHASPVENPPQTSNWIRAGNKYVASLAKLPFPLTGDMPEIYAPQRTVLVVPSGAHCLVFLWCYLERKTYGPRYVFNPGSLSLQRMKDMPTAIDRLSRKFRFDRTSSRTVQSLLMTLSLFLNLLDAREPGNYSSVLSDGDLALRALQTFHTHLRQRMQSNGTHTRISAAVAGQYEANVIRMMTTIHGRQYANEIEPIRTVAGEGVKAPKSEDVAALLACVQGVFDSVVRVVQQSPKLTANQNQSQKPVGNLTWQSEGREACVPIPKGTSYERLMELGCMAFAALCGGDSGANLAQIQAYEEPEDLQEQLAIPERLNVRQKVIKLRAGGKAVPVHLTSVTVTRLTTYLGLREALRLRLGCADVTSMFVRGVYGSPGNQKPTPVAIAPLSRTFTSDLRSRFRSMGIELPNVTMQELREYKQGDVSRKNSPMVAADMMGHSVATAIRKYSKIAEAESRSEMAPFLASLTQVVLKPHEGVEDRREKVVPITAIPTGACESHGNPKPLADNSLVKLDCQKTEGCFFCDKYRVHADETDTVKLMSCRRVLQSLTTGTGGAGVAQRVYAVVVARIDALLKEVERINPGAYRKAKDAVVVQGLLSRYWAVKLQQLHMLGLIAKESTGHEA